MYNYDKIIEQKSLMSQLLITLI